MPRLRPSAALVALTALAAACHLRPSDAELKAELLRRVAEDQRIRAVFAEELRAQGRPSDSTAVAMLRTDSANTRWLAPIVDRWGFPTQAAVGKEGVQAAFLLVQHADHDPAFQERVLVRLDSAAARGYVPREALGMLTDRVLRARGKPQRYGTQLKVTDGRVVLDPVEDSAHLEERRKAMGMVPMAEYLRVADSAYGRRR